MAVITGYQVVLLFTLSMAIFIIYWNTIEQDVGFSKDSFLIRTFTRPQPVESENFLIHTPGCKIHDPFKLSTEKSSKISPPSDTGFNCSNLRSMLIVNGTTIKLKRIANFSLHFDKCEICPVKRVLENLVVTGQVEPLNVEEEHKITDEFIKVECFKKKKLNYQEFFAFIHRKKEVDERCENAILKFDSRNQLSVLILGLDSVSHAQYARFLQRTDQFLKTLPFIKFYGYHKVGLNTFPNMIPFHTGKEVEYYKMDFSKADINSLPLVWKEFSRRGYRTLFAEDSPSIAIFNYLKRGFSAQPTDYYLRPFSVAVEDSYVRKKSRSGCLHSRVESSVVLKWVEDFFDQFPKDPLFAFAFLTRATHDNAKGSKNQDEPIESFLRSLHEKGHLNKTIVFFVSDHGFRFGDSRLTYVGHIEEKLPFNVMVVPTWFSRKYPQLYSNLKTNERRLVTPFDMHRTLLDIVANFQHVTNSYEWNERSVSLFSPISDRRSCMSAGIKSEYCVCIDRQQVPLSESVAEKAAEILLTFINSLTKELRSLCFVFKLVEVVEVTSQKMLMDDGSVASNYQVTLRADPGEAIFQGVVWYNSVGDSHHVGESYHVEETVDRLSSYGNQSDCIDYFKLKAFCYCKSHLPR